MQGYKSTTFKAKKLDKNLTIIKKKEQIFPSILLCKLKFSEYLSILKIYLMK